MTRNSIRPRQAVIATAFVYCAVVSFLVFLQFLAAGKFGNDFGVYWRVAHQPADTAYLFSGQFPFPYAPTTLLWVAPIAWIPFWPGFAGWSIFSAAALALACRSHLSKGAIALVLVSPVVVVGLLAGQCSVALAALIISACGTSNRPIAGVAFAIVASVKPQLVIMAPLIFALDRDWRAFSVAALAFAAIVALSVVLFGPDRWFEWVASMHHFHRAVSGTNVIAEAVAPAALAERFGLPPLPVLVCGVAAGVALACSGRRSGPLGKAAAITVGSILAAPYAMAYDLSAAVPAMALFLFEGHLPRLTVRSTSLLPVLAHWWSERRPSPQQSRNPRERESRSSRRPPVG